LVAKPGKAALARAAIVARCSGAAWTAAATKVATAAGWATMAAMTADDSSASAA